MINLNQARPPDGPSSRHEVSRWEPVTPSEAHGRSPGMPCCDSLLHATRLRDGHGRRPRRPRAERSRRYVAVIYAIPSPSARPATTGLLALASMAQLQPLSLPACQCTPHAAMPRSWPLAEGHTVQKFKRSQQYSATETIVRRSPG